MSEFETARVGPILADLLMGAAYADDNFDGREGEVVRSKLAEWLEVDELPQEIEQQLKSFNPDTFDLTTTVALLALDNDEQKRKLLEVVAAVQDADEILDLDEDAYLRDLASALGVADREYSDLKLDVLSVEDIREGIKGLSAKPPPIPKN